MAIKESLYSGDWLAKAKQDLKRAGILLEADDTEGAGFNLQQAVEKSIKAFLLFNGWKLKRIHDLVKLLNSAINYEPDFEEYRWLCEQITEYYLEERYPFFGSVSPNSEEIEEALDKSKELIEKIEVKLAT